MYEIPHELARGPFTLAHAAELGIPPRVLDGARFARPWPGLRVLRDHPDTLLERCRAATLILPPSAVFSHATARDLGGWDRPWQPERGRLRYSPPQVGPETAIHISVPDGTARPHGRGIIGHRFSPLKGDIVEQDGLHITSDSRTWCDLAAAGAEEVDLVILADSLRRRDRHAVERLTERLIAWGCRRGARSLRTALALSRFDSDDEADVRVGRASDWRQRTDNARHDQLDDIGWTLRVFTSFDVYRRADLAAERMRMVLRRAGAPV